MFNKIIAIGTILLQIKLLVIFFSWIMKSNLLKIVYKNANIILRFVFVGAILGSLVYQYIVGYPPCMLCWYQRIAIFSIGVILFTGDVRVSKILQTQVLILSLLGTIVAIFHNIIDIFPTGLDVCGANGPSCLARYVYEFGYITIPIMSLTVLLFGVLIPIITMRFPQYKLDNPTNQDYN